MQPEKKIELNGSQTEKGNYLWGGALTLAWQELKDQIIKEEVKIDTNDSSVEQIVYNFNNSPFNKTHLSEEAYYISAGFGNNAVKKINEEVGQKFPSKSTEKLEENLHETDIIAYAYFFKKILFQMPFKKGEVKFNNQIIKGFYASEKDQKKQILVHAYNDRDNFIVRLKTTNPKEQIFLLKSSDKHSAEEVVKKIKSTNLEGQQLQSSDKFTMPNVSIHKKRQVKELIGVPLANQAFTDYIFTEFQEIIKLDIDETGVKAENEGVIIASRSCMISMTPPKEIILDKPFWLIMREEGQQPYLLAYIAEPLDD